MRSREKRERKQWGMNHRKAGGTYNECSTKGKKRKIINVGERGMKVRR